MASQHHNVSASIQMPSKPLLTMLREGGVVMHEQRRSLEALHLGVQQALCRHTSNVCEAKSGLLTLTGEDTLVGVY